MGINTEIHDQILCAFNELESANKKEWLIDNFELYKEMLIWPVGLPAIARSYLDKDALKFQFYNLYRDVLQGFNHEFNNHTQRLIFYKL